MIGVDYATELGVRAPDPRPCDHLIEEARRFGAGSVVLQTNHRLATAIQLCRSRVFLDTDASVNNNYYRGSSLPLRLDLTERAADT